MHISGNLPYYAVIFTANKTGTDVAGFDKTLLRMKNLALKQTGCKGVDDIHNPDGTSVIISYWRDKKAIRAWHEHTEHWIAQEMGKTKWLASYRVRVCKVERDYVGGQQISRDGISQLEEQQTAT